MQNRHIVDNWGKETRERAQIFRSCVPLQLAAHEVRRALGNSRPEQVLTVGAENPMLLHYFRQCGGTWRHVVRTVEDVDVVRDVTGVDPTVLDWNALPFEDKTFDVVVVIDCLESAPDGDAFIHECHRVLKNDSRLVLCAHNHKRFSLLRLFHRQRSRGGSAAHLRTGYTEKELFLLLKNGFDVIGMRSYTRFLVETIDVWARASLARGHRPGRVYRMAGIFYRIAYQLDMLFFLTRGHRWIVVGKRRTWRPRQAPVLGDCRTITEAVLSRPTE